MKKTVLLGLSATIIAIAIVVVGGILLLQEKSETEKEKNQIPRPVPTVQAGMDSKPLQRSFPGSVKAARKLKLAFSVSGQLCKLNAEKGQKVLKGSVLAQIDRRDFENSLASAQADYVQKKAAFMRIKRLREKNISSQAEFESANADFTTASAILKLRRKALADTTLTVPFDAVIADRYVENYEHVNTGIPIVSLYDMTKVEVVIQVPESLICEYTPDKWKDITVQFNDIKENVCLAKVKECQATPNSITGTYDITLAVDASLSTKLKLLPGMTVNVIFTLRKTQDSKVSIPSSAVFCDDSGNSYVWVVNPHGGIPDKRRIMIAKRYQNRLVIQAGIHTGEYVAIAGIHSIVPDQPVRPQQTGKDGLEG